MKAHEFIKDWTSEGYGVALCELPTNASGQVLRASTLKVIDPYCDSFESEQTLFDAPIVIRGSSAELPCGRFLVLHSGQLEEQYREQREAELLAASAAH